MSDELSTKMQITPIPFIFFGQSVSKKHVKSSYSRCIFTRLAGPIQVTSKTNSFGSPLSEPSDLHHLRHTPSVDAQRPTPLAVEDYQRIVVISCGGICGDLSGHRKDPADKVKKGFEIKLCALVADCQSSVGWKDIVPRPGVSAKWGEPDALTVGFRFSQQH
jgi:hypothetical protein